MNPLYPTPGDRWTRPGKNTIEVLAVTVRIKQGKKEFDMTLDQYRTSAALSAEKGDTLTKNEPEDEDPTFE